MDRLVWHTEQAVVKDLIQLEINPRKISDDQRHKLLKSLDKFNLVEIPAVDVDKKIIGGNQRVSALILAGRGNDVIDVRVPNRALTEEEIKEYAIISNTHAGEFDFDILDLHFNDIDFDDIGFKIEGLKEWELQQEDLLLDQIEEDEYEIPDEIETSIQVGDLIEIGDHRLLCGDSTLPESWALLCGEERIDLLLTDPPYNVNYQGKTKAKLKIENDNLSEEDFDLFLISAFASANEHLKPGAVFYIWHADSMALSFRIACKQAEWKVRQCLIWNKNGLVMGRQDYQWKHEPCLYGWKDGAAHKWISDRKQTTVLEFDKPLRNAEHPTMKPIPLMAYQVKNSSLRGDIVADGFAGSGSTMVASHKLKRICYGIEYDPKYCQVQVDRMLALDPKLEVKINGEPWSTQMNS